MVAFSQKSNVYKLYTLCQLLVNELKINYITERSNFATMSKANIHIGKKIKEILDKTPISVVDFAKNINLTRNGAYKVFDKETIDTGQLQVISKVLNHDFFNYYEQNPSSAAKESKGEYGFVTKHEFDSKISELTFAVLKLAKTVESFKEQLPASRTSATKKAAVKKKSIKKKHD